MTRMAEAFESLLEAQGRAIGPRRVRIGRQIYDAIIDELGGEQIFAAGGEAESGGFRAQIAKSLFAARPRKFADAQIVGSGTEFQILSVNEVNGVTYEITAGDPMQGRQ